jgi:hypothetical protein
MTTPGPGAPQAPEPADPPAVEKVDDVRRTVSRETVDGRRIEVRAARRGVMMRGGLTGDAGGSNPLELVVGLVVTFVADVVLEAIAGERPWKVKVYDRSGILLRRLHREVLPAGVAPEARMVELLDEYAPRP